MLRKLCTKNLRANRPQIGWSYQLTALLLMKENRCILANPGDLN